MYKPCQRVLECIITKYLTNSSCCLAGRRLKRSFVGKKMFVFLFEKLFIMLGTDHFYYILLGCREEVFFFCNIFHLFDFFNDIGLFYAGATLKYYTQIIYPRIPRCP